MSDFVKERWRKPVKPVAVELDLTKVEYVAGRWVHPLNTTITPEDFERVREGYVCLDCWEPQPVPYPDKCRLCGCRMSPPDYWHERIENEFEGWKHVGPSTTIEQELDRLDDYAERKFWTPGSQVYIPPGVKL